jgi:ornithine--oxo-acid transaminase
MTFDVTALFDQHLSTRLDLAGRHFNPGLVQALRLLGLDRAYARAEGCWVYDADGARYLDMLCGYRVLNLGHNHPVVRRALTDAIERCLPNMLQVDISPLTALLARELSARATPGLEIVRFCSSGSEAVEMAMKFARRATGRPRLLAARHGYHGLTYGPLSLSGRPDLWHEGFTPVLPKCETVPFDDLAALERELSSGDVAAFIVEPIQGEAGIVVPSDEYLPEAQRLCRQYGTLFVLDEIQTGLGRTGRFLAAEHWGLEPDMVCLAKALSGGLVPVGATLMRREIAMRVFGDVDNCAIHFSTYEGNTLAMVAGLATLHVLESERLVENAERTGALLLERLRELQHRHESIAEVRGKGLFVALRFSEPRSLGPRLAWKLMRETGDGFYAQTVIMALLRDHRVLIQTAGHDPNVLDCTPALIAGEAEVEYFVQALDQVLTGCSDAVKLPAEMTSSVLKQALALGVPLDSLQLSRA